MKSEPQAAARVDQMTMPDDLTRHDANDADEPSESLARLQWSLRTLLLLTAGIAVWVTYFQFRRQIPRLETDIASMRRMAGELVIEDPEQIAVVRLPETWYDENRWDIHLPRGAYRLKAATRAIDKQGFAPIVQEANVSDGRHEIEWLTSKKDELWRITVTVDGNPLIEIDEKADWNSGVGLYDGGEFNTSRQLPTNEPVVLFRRRFMLRSPTGTSV